MGSRRRQRPRRPRTGKVGGTSTAGRVIGCLLLWIIAFPFYLVQRSTFLAGDRPLPPPALPTKATLTHPGQRGALPQPATFQTSPHPPCTTRQYDRGAAVSRPAV